MESSMIWIWDNPLRIILRLSKSFSSIFSRTLLSYSPNNSDIGMGQNKTKNYEESNFWDQSANEIFNHRISKDTVGSKFVNDKMAAAG